MNQNRHPKGRPTGGQFAGKQRDAAPYALTLGEGDEELWSRTQLALSLAVEEAKLGGYAAGTEDANTVRVIDNPDGRDLVVSVVDEKFHVSTTDATGKVHTATQPRDWGPRSWDRLRFAADRVREAAASNEALREAIDEVGGDTEPNFTGGDFLVDHENYGDLWALQVAGGDDGYVVGPYIDPVTENLTDEIAVVESGDTHRVDDDVAREVLERATGISDPGQAAEYIRKIGTLAMARYRQKTAG